MPKRSRNTPSDPNVLATSIVARAIGETPTEQKNPHAVALGRLGGLKGGKVRAEKLTPAKRREIAKIAANTRWSKNLLPKIRKRDTILDSSPLPYATKTSYTY